MEYGLVGRRLTHSFSKIIHERVANYVYEINDIDEDSLKTLLIEKSFKAVNVTVPYKQTVIPYLDYIDESVKNIGSCNCIVNKDGKLCGYNTDYLGILKMLEYYNISLKDKVIAILGTGGTSKTMQYVAKVLGAKKIYVVSRNKSDNYIDYDELTRIANDIDIIANTTPVGMYPNNDELVLDLSHFLNLESYIDVIYNPLKTKAAVDAEALDLKVATGLLMLVAQAFYGIELFIGKKVDNDEMIKVYNEILNDKKNIVLIGMPGCGKSTIGKALAEKLNKNFVDTDSKIEEYISTDIASYIKENGEKKFREVESKIISTISLLQSHVISTGGGVILNRSNINHLKQNGVLVFIDRDLDKLETSDSRPLSSNKEDLKKRYDERIDLYNKYADIKVKNNDELSDVITRLEKML